MDTKNLVKAIKHLEIYTNKKVNEIFAGNYKSSFRGQGLEFSDLREYEEGDDVRHIDWMTTAKQGRPYIKKFQETRELTTMIIADISDSMKFTTAKKTKSRILIEITAYILFSSLKNNDKFGAIIFTNQIYSYIPPKKGKKHLLYILREIIKGFNIQKTKKTNLNIALDFLNKTIKKRSICFLLSDNLCDNEHIEYSKLKALKIANQKHDFIYINIFDNFEKKINIGYPNLKIINPETEKIDIINLSNKKLIDNYNKIRSKKYDYEFDILNKNQIDHLSIATTGNVYKDLLLFFRKRALRF